MRLILVTLLLVPSLAFAGKKPKSEPAAAPAPAPAPAPVEEPAPPPPEEPPPPMDVRANNVSFSVTLSSKGGSRSGHVRGIERADDFHGDRGWLSGAKEITFEIELPKGGEKVVAWSDVKSISITPGKVPDGVDCTYSSDFNPFMYECSINTTSTATLKDGTKGTIITRNKWRFTFDDGAPVELYLSKHTERMQADATPGEDQEEDPKMYAKLQQALRETIAGPLVSGITIQ